MCGNVPAVGGRRLRLGEIVPDGRVLVPRPDHTLKRNVSRVTMTSADTDVHTADLHLCRWQALISGDGLRRPAESADCQRSADGCPRPTYVALFMAARW
jgi:hypothetical protein